MAIRGINQALFLLFLKARGLTYSTSKVESGKWKVESGKWKVESGKLDLNTLNQQYPAVVASKSKSFIYAPNLELLRFMTPFGVGFFNDHERTKDRKPPYIPHWEDEVVWSENITHLLSELEEEVFW